MEGIGVAANLIAIVDISAKIAAQCYDYGKKVCNAKADIDRLQKEVSTLTGIAKSVEDLLGGPNGNRLATSHQLKAAIGEALGHLEKVDERITLKKGQKTMSRLGLRALKWPFEKGEIEGLVGDLRNCGQNINSALQIDQTANVRRTEQGISQVDQKIVLSQLPVAEGACFGSEPEDHELTCLPNTRVDLLQQIHDWVRNPNVARVFWLNGMAGTGKSTISRTVAQRLDDDKILGASFFFKTGEAERNSLSKFFSTIAADMAIKVPEFSTAVKEALDKDPDFRKRAPGKQLKDLVIEPLMRSQKHRLDRPIVLIVDALDECDRDQDIDLLVNLFTDPSVMKMPYLKFFITSRPEIPNRRAFGRATEGTYQPVILHQLPQPVIEHDISVFLDHQLDKIRTQWNNLVTSDDRRFPSDWPGQERTRQLVEMAVPLFIFASTMCRFIADAKFGSPDDQIQDVLTYRKSKTKSRLDSTYLPVLNKLVAGMDADDRSQVIQKFKLIVGSIVMLETPLSTDSLSRLLEVSKNYIDDHLMMLHSVLSIPTSSDSPVRMLHLSFRDFLTDVKNKESTAFWIDEKVVHADIASRALTILDRELKQNICNLSKWGAERSSINVTTINACIPPEVKYSCYYWVHHVQHADHMLIDGGLVHNFFQIHFLHWLECLSLLGGAYECIGHVKTLQMLIDVSACPITSLLTSAPKLTRAFPHEKQRDGKELSLFLDDALSFVLANASVIDATPLQLYSSLLVFAPTGSYVRNIYERVIPKEILLHPKVDSDWGKSLHILECDTEFVSFSHDSKMVASPDSTVTGDIVRIWDVHTGQCIWILEGHENTVSSAVFSHDSARVLSASWDGSIRVWSTSTGENIRIIKNFTQNVFHGFSSSSSASILSGSGGDTVKILKPETGECIRQFDAPSHEVHSAAVSPNTKFAAYCYFDGKARMLNLDTDINIPLIDAGTQDDVHSFAFSHDSAFLAYASEAGGKVRIVRTNGERVRELEHPGQITSIAFSPDAALLASSNNYDIWIWNLETGKCVQVLTGHARSITHITFSHDATLVASASNEETVRIWRVDTSFDDHTSNQNEYPTSVERANFSPDSTVVATWDDSSVKIWDAMTGECKRVLPSDVKALSQDWSLVLTGGLEDSCSSPQILRVDTGAPVQTLHGDLCKIEHAEFSPDSTLVAMVTQGYGLDTTYTAGIWLVETGQCVQLLQHESNVKSAIFSPNGQVVATCTEFDISLWSTRDWRRMRNWELGQRSIDLKMTFSADSTLILCHRDHLLKVWHCGSGKCLLELKHRFIDYGCVFSNNSKFIASIFIFPNTSRVHYQVQLWCINTSQHLYSIESGPALDQHIGLRLGDLVRFTPDDSGLETSTGVIALSNFPPAPWNNAPRSFSISGYGISMDTSWITWDGDKLLRIPTQYRPTCSAVHLGTVVLVSDSGRIIILRFAPTPPETVSKTPI
ncbi:unnamed protein product [Clonostachys rosea]|uniref:NACHT domain-containing protein n=1 Tax=Bionectria ochroleuca TaxID=29856 RepID=A0ABY6TPY0_BIOOC|nr:unnamed protein product [Clonostachys rosea]